MTLDLAAGIRSAAVSRQRTGSVPKALRGGFVYILFWAEHRACSFVTLVCGSDFFLTLWHWRIRFPTADVAAPNDWLNPSVLRPCLSNFVRRSPQLVVGRQQGGILNFRQQSRTVARSFAASLLHSPTFNRVCGSGRSGTRTPSLSPSLCYKHGASRRISSCERQPGLEGFSYPNRSLIACARE